MKMLNYFIRGFYLTNKRWEIIFLGLLLGIIPFSKTLESSLGRNDLLLLPWILISLAFGLSIPAFFLQVQQRHQISLKEIMVITLSNSKRLIKPGLLLALVFILALILLSTALAVSGFSSADPFSWLGGGVGQILLSAFAIGFSLLAFVPILFSIEKKGFFLSNWQSIKISWQNLPFILIIATWNVLDSLARGLFAGKNPLAEDVYALFYFYITIIITAATLYYYQEVVKGK